MFVPCTSQPITASRSGAADDLQYDKEEKSLRQPRKTQIGNPLRLRQKRPGCE